MKRKNAFLLIYLLFMTGVMHAGQPADSVFMNYFRQAQLFANTYPREKVHLHFDNTSYYLGDTIWFKSYVTLAEGNQPTPVSKPLYVELLDQLGNVVERQIIQLRNGEGNGQIALDETFFTGYYEVRAYTKWMLAFDEQQYFSRTLPIYRKRMSKTDEARSIGSYYMDDSMKQRPNDKDKSFTVRFFPEGGRLVKGIQSIVAFEADTREKGKVDIEGVIRSESGEQLALLQTLHDGMGYFAYCPGEKSAKAEVVYEGKKYTFTLPEVLPSGYTLRVDNRQDLLEVSVARSSLELADTLALFVSSQGRPYTYEIVDFNGRSTQRFRIPAKDLPSGVVQLTLLTKKGNTLCERFCYLMPKDGLQIESVADKALYKPYDWINCRIKLVDAQKRPLQTNFSVAVRDGLNSDYQEFDNNIYTDLLLTSDLKGYIHQPGYYFAEQTAGRRKMLDILLLVRGWRKYDMEKVVGAKAFFPKYMPETKLTLYGQIKSLFGKPQANLGVSILARKDSVSIAGMTETDSLGYFHVSVDGFEGTMSAFIQTRKQGKNTNRQTTVSLFRNFEPELRRLDYQELNPVWKDPNEQLSKMMAASDSAYMKDSKQWQDYHLLDEVVVNAKRMFNSLQKTKKFETEILGYYNLAQIVDKLRDDGKSVNHFPELMENVNPNISVTIGENPKDMTYNLSPLMYVVNGRLMSAQDRETFLDEDIDVVQTVMLYNDQTGGESIFMMNRNTNRVMQRGKMNFWSKMDGELGADEADAMNADFGNSDEDVFAETAEEHSNGEETEESSLENSEEDTEKLEEKKLSSELATKKNAIVCSIITIPFWDPEKSYKSQKGIRHTYIQGYEQPKEFYSPAYPDGVPAYVEDHRRTLYWNPNVKTNEQGEAIVQCYNSKYSTPLTVSMETLYKGCPVALEFYSAGKVSGDTK